MPLDIPTLAGWKRLLTGDGYIRIPLRGHPLANKRGYVLEHRFVLYEAGIAIPPGHHVHHINGIRTDNRLENLEVLSRAEHRKRHRAFSPEEGQARKKALLRVWLAANRERVNAVARRNYWSRKERRRATAS